MQIVEECDRGAREVVMPIFRSFKDAQRYVRENCSEYTHFRIQQCAQGSSVAYEVINYPLRSRYARENQEQIEKRRRIMSLT